LAEGDPSARRRALLSPIGLEPVVSDPGPASAPRWPEPEAAPVSTAGRETD
jgi:hypothetical protein